MSYEAQKLGEKVQHIKSHQKWQPMEPIDLVDIELKTHVHDQPNVTEEQAFASFC